MIFFYLQKMRHCGLGGRGRGLLGGAWRFPRKNYAQPDDEAHEKDQQNEGNPATTAVLFYIIPNILLGLNYIRLHQAQSNRLGLLPALPNTGTASCLLPTSTMCMIANPRS
jgi:hypothetical protein